MHIRHHTREDLTPDPTPGQIQSQSWGSDVRSLRADSRRRRPGDSSRRTCQTGYLATPRHAVRKTPAADSGAAFRRIGNVVPSARVVLHLDDLYSTGRRVPEIPRPADAT